MVTIEYRRVLGPITETRHVETVEEALAFSAHLILRHYDVRCMKRDAQLLLTGDQICAALDNLGNDSAFVLEERDTSFDGATVASAASLPCTQRVYS